MSNEVTLSINGQSVSVPAGTTIIQAAQKLGVHVPHFCWHPGLSIAGVCRFCMVKIEGNPKLQIACNTPVGEGMKVDTVNDEVKDAHKWALEFHLINHPLDCPICDQAGECELQNYYMKVGRYDSQMDEEKVLKPKALDVGDTLVLDTERCILCSRCVRFEDEVTKTSTLGIFNRGDVAVIGTYKDRRITHNYSYNIADICPVGAFTAKDFRFKCRVWFLSETKTVCPGCSTGCNVTLFQNKNQRDYYRLKPRFNEQVNGHWMCDYGRTMYEHLNAGARLSQPLLSGKATTWDVAASALAAELKAAGAQGTALVLTPQETVEDYEALLSGLEGLLGSLPAITVWRPTGETPEAFDGLLFRGDRHPNSKGLAEVLAKRGLTVTTQQGAQLAPLTRAGAAPSLTLVFGPEVEKAYEGFEGDLGRLAKAGQAASGGKVCYIGISLSQAANAFWMRLPSKTFAEKGGTYVNVKGVHQRLKANAPVMPHVRGVGDILAAVAAAPAKGSTSGHALGAKAEASPVPV